MNINRNTYEEYFLLYIDNELLPADRKEVEAFVESNPDLREELEMLRDTVLPADDTIEFNKQSLFRSHQPVTEANHEEYFVLYGDHELTREEQEHVEQFVYRHPQHQAEFELILRARTEPDHFVVFQNKEVLFRSEKEERPVMYMRFVKIAVAAAVLIFMGGFGWYFSTRESNRQGQLANGTKAPTQQTVTPTVPANDSALASIDKSTEETSNTTSSQPLESTNPAPRRKQANQSPDNAILASNQKKSDNSSNISVVPTVQHKTTEMPAIDTREVSEPDVTMIAANLDLNKEIVDRAVGAEELRTGVRQPDIIDATESNDDNVVYVANTSVNKKNKLRGVFRKASRIFEKATNIDPTEGDRAVRIAGFEIALK